MERGREREEAWSFDGASESKRSAASQSEENKENLLVSSELQDDLLLYQDEEALNASIISGERGAGGWLPSGCSQEVLPLGEGWSLRVWGWHSCHQHGGRIGRGCTRQCRRESHLQRRAGVHADGLGAPSRKHRGSWLHFENCMFTFLCV